MQCSQIKPDGNRCEANAIKNSELCFSHNPELADKKKAAVIKGGLNRQLYGVYGEEMEISTAWDIEELLNHVINGVLTGKIPTNQPATTLAYLARCWLEAHTKSWDENRAEMMDLNRPINEQRAEIFNNIFNKRSERD